MGRWEKEATLIHFFLALLVVGSAAIPARAQTEGSATVWEKHFPHAINWCRRTSGGILIVYSGKTLTAINGPDGKQLWSFPYIELGGSDSGWTSPNEVPGFPILLINRAKLSRDDSEHLLGVDLMSGAIQWKQDALNDPFQLFLIYKSDRVLLITNKGRILNKPVLTLLDTRTGHADWTTEYSNKFSSRGIGFSEWNDHAYLFNRFPPLTFYFSLGRVDLGNGKPLWEFTKHTFQQVAEIMIVPENTIVLESPPPVFAGGLVIFEAKYLLAFDPATGKQV
jgi:hypothetical protein